MPNTAEMIDILAEGSDYATNRVPLVDQEHGDMSEKEPGIPSTAREFSESAKPSLEAVLLSQIALFKAGKLNFVGRDEWDREIEKTHEMFQQSQQMAERNLKRSKPE